MLLVLTWLRAGEYFIGSGSVALYLLTIIPHEILHALCYKGDVYLYNGDEFVTFNLTEALGNLDVDLAAIWAAIRNLQNRMSTAEGKITNIENTIAPIVNRWELPANVPDDAKIMLGNINLYSDYNAAIDGSGNITSLDRSHGVYGHSLLIDKSYDEIFG